MKIKVVCDGDQTFVYDENGNDISKFVNAVEWKHEHGKKPEAKVTFVAAALDWIGEARENVEAIKDNEANLAKNR